MSFVVAAQLFFNPTDLISIKMKPLCSVVSFVVLFYLVFFEKKNTCCFDVLKTHEGHNMRQDLK